MDVLGATIRCGVSLARSVGTGFLLLDLYILLFLMISLRFGTCASVIFVQLLIFIIVSAISFMQLWFTVVMRRLGGGLDSGSHGASYKWLRPDLVHPAPFLQCEPRLTPGGSGVLADRARIDEEFRKAWLPYFCRSGQREASLDEFNFEVVMGG